jgi:hypothetical protein
MGLIGITLMGTPASEACCERFFSILHRIYRKDRSLLSFNKLAQTVVTREYSPN